MKHTTFVLKRKNGEEGQIYQRKARLVVCANAGVDVQEETISPVAHHLITKLVLCLYIQQSWSLKHLDFESVFTSAYLKQPAFPELPREIFP